jgi:2-dehydropantoate 2-reductase
MNDIKTVAVVGMGALGMMYGQVIQDGIGKEKFKFVMDNERYNKYKDKDSILNGKPYSFTKISVDDAAPVDFVIVAVKYPSLDSALEIIRPLIKEDTVIMSVMNGITSEDILADTFGKDHLVYTVGQGMDSMNIGGELFYTKMGIIYFGVPEDASERQKENVKLIDDLFNKVNMPHVVEEDIMRRMWAKFM